MTCVRKSDWMSVVWAATSPESGLFHPVERRSEVKDLSDRFNDLRSRGEGGYVEVRTANREFPVLTLAFRGGDHAVVHLMSDTERLSLLVGDGTVPQVPRLKSRSWTASPRSRATLSWMSIGRGIWCTTSPRRGRLAL